MSTTWRRPLGWKNRQLRGLCLAVITCVLAGCAGNSPTGERDAERARLDEMCDQTLQKLIASNPELDGVIGDLPGYAVVDMTLTKVPGVGVGGGYGVVVDNRDGQRNYVKVSRFDAGSGLGAQKFKVVVLFEDEVWLDRALSPRWHFDAGAEAAAGDAGAAGGVGDAGKGYRVFRVREAGAAASVTVRLVRATRYLE